MLRLLVLLLAAANIVFLAWTIGWLDDVVGVRAIGDREPERLTRQVRPESIRILPGSGSAKPSASTTTPASTAAAVIAAVAPAADAGALPSCLEAGPFSTTQFASVEALLQLSLPSGSWTHLRTERPALWMVYMGKFSDAETMAKRQEELRRLKVDYEVLRAPSELVPGLSLGRFEIRANANNLLDQLTQRGVRNARAIEAAPATSAHLIRIDRPTASITTQLSNLRADALGKGFQPCSRP